MRVRRIDHLAIAVPDIEQALGFYRDALGLEVSHVGTESGQAVKVAFMPVGSGEIELIEPVDADSGVARFLQARGAGMHHICLEVDDLDEALVRLREAGVELIGEGPYVNRLGRRLIFIHPRSAWGVLIELYQVMPAVGPDDSDAVGRDVTGRTPEP